MHITLHPTALCTWCVLCAFAGERLTLIFLCACLAHEAGHLVCMACFGVPLQSCQITARGAVINSDVSHLPFPREAAIHMAGITVNLLCAAALYTRGCTHAAAVHALLACYNLLPFPNNDGAHVLSALAGVLSPLAERRLRRMLSVVATALDAGLYIFAAWLFWYGITVSANMGIPGGGILCGGLFGRMLYHFIEDK